MNPDDLITQVRAGTFDSQLADLLAAIRFRVDGGKIQFRWKIALPDLEVTEDDMTLGEMERVCAKTKGSWRALAPASNPGTCAEIIRVCAQTRLGESADEAQARVDRLTGAELVKALSEYEVRNPPLS